MRKAGQMTIGKTHPCLIQVFELGCLWNIHWGFLLWNQWLWIFEFLKILSDFSGSNFRQSHRSYWWATVMTPSGFVTFKDNQFLEKEKSFLFVLTDATYFHDDHIAWKQEDLRACEGQDPDTFEYPYELTSSTVCEIFKGLAQSFRNGFKFLYTGGILCIPKTLSRKCSHVFRILFYPRTQKKNSLQIGIRNKKSFRFYWSLW